MVPIILVITGQNLVHGAIYTYYDVVLTFRGNNNFINNSAIIGGVIFARDYKYATLGSVTLTFNGTNNFINNSAIGNGGAIYTSENT